MAQLGRELSVMQMGVVAPNEKRINQSWHPLRFQRGRALEMDVRVRDGGFVADE